MKDIWTNAKIREEEVDVEEERIKWRKGRTGESCNEDYVKKGTG